MRPPPQPQTTTTPVSSLTCNPMPTSIPSNHVSVAQYNSILTRLDSEIQLRAQLEADLVATREEVAYLRAQLADRAMRPLHSSTEQEPPHAQPIRPSLTSSASQQTKPSEPHHKVTEREETLTQAVDSNGRKGHDKEILSHCSDISATKSAARSTDINSSKKSSHRKSSGNLAAANGVTKKSKSKKERPAKVKIPGQSRYWTPEEHKLFLEALNKYGHKDLRAISAFVGTRNMTQVRTHSQKYFMRLMREAKRQNPVTKPASSTDEVETSDEIPAPAPPSRTPSVSQLASEAPNEVSAPAPATAPSTSKDVDGDKYSVPNTCGMTLLCLVGQDTLPV